MNYDAIQCGAKIKFAYMYFNKMSRAFWEILPGILGNVPGILGNTPRAFWEILPGKKAFFDRAKLLEML